jgi:histidyl-tRNA synthetase
MQIIQAVRGMNDILPEESLYWHFLEQQLIQLAQNYGYQEIRFPIVEATSLFKRSIGEATDIVEKEMYTFEDKGGDSLTLRPEGTAGCVRVAIEHGLLHNQQQRWYYLGPMFRHERPQKGRYRQFHQFGLEIFGSNGAAQEVELMLMMLRLWKQLGLDHVINLELNSLGTSEVRARYRERLLKYLRQHQDQLDADSIRRLETNPLRILDSKNPQMQTLIENAPILLDDLDETSKKHFDAVCQLLKDCGVKYKINPRLVRGLDYYSHTVFEWVTEQLGAQNAVCSGGRYDGLVEILGGKPTTAFGLALGMERVIRLLQENRKLTHTPDIFFIAVGEAAQRRSLSLAEELRTLLPSLSLILNCDGASFKSQFKRADKSGAVVALILAEDELANNKLAIKFLREERPQESLSFDETVTVLRQQFLKE